MESQSPYSTAFAPGKNGVKLIHIYEEEPKIINCLEESIGNDYA